MTSMRNIAAAAKKRLFAFVTIIVFIPLLYAEDFFFDSAGVKIHYTVEGKGEPVLLIHGFGGDQTNWSAGGIIKELSNTFEVIAIDNRGHGKSEKPHDPAAYGMEMVEDSIRLLDHLKIRKAHVAGYSMGGRITCAIVGYHPERLRSAVLGGYGWYPPGNNPLVALREEMAESLEQGKGIEPLITFLNPIGAPPPTPEQIASSNKMFLSNNDVLALAAVMRNSAPSPTEKQLRANRVPLLALVGELDSLKSSVDRLNGLVPNLKIVVIPKANHLTAVADPEFIKNLKAFLMEHSAAISPKKSKERCLRPVPGVPTLSCLFSPRREMNVETRFTGQGSISARKAPVISCSDQSRPSRAEFE
jgi:pimeloyl-ACP methyl ester carboxylesterase